MKTLYHTKNKNRTCLCDLVQMKEMLGTKMWSLTPMEDKPKPIKAKPKAKAKDGE